jgi:GNAT superfamily N-acetyltransferase
VRATTPPARALDDNFTELLRWYASFAGGTVVQGSDAWLCHAGVSFRAINAAVRIRLRDATRVEQVNSFFADRGMPWRWLVGPTSRPAELEGWLMGSGLVRIGDNPGMALPLDGFEVEPPPPGIAIERVGDEAGLERWRDVQRQGLALDPVRAEAWWTAHRRPGFGENLPLVNWVATLDGRPVSAAALFDAAGVAGIYNVVTVPDARGRGIGRAVTSTAIAEGARRGRRLAVLGSSDLGLPMYRRVGFREVSRLRSYAPRD